MYYAPMVKTKKRTVISLAGTVLLSTFVVGALHFNKSGAETEPPIIQEVKHQGQVLDNHEDRITNTEKDVSDLQNNTQTAPNSTRTVVREVTTPSPTEPIASPIPDLTIRVASAVQRVDGTNENGKFYCDLVYSDNTQDSVFQGQSLSLTNASEPPHDFNCQKYVGQAK